MPNIYDYFVPTERQLEAYQYVGRGGRIFYGGARGGGKTAYALWAAVMVSKLFPGLKTVAIRETYPELEEAFITNLILKYPENVFGYVYKDKTKTATFRNGSKIIFRACDSPKAAKKIQGIEYQFMVIDEAPNFDVLTIHKLSGSLRTSLKNNFIPSLLMTGNPGGISDNYFISHFVTPNYSDWEDYELKHKDKFYFVPATVYDNEHVTADYREMLEGLPEHLRLAWLEGRWGVFEGQFFEEWDPTKHIIEPFDIPQHWTKKAGMDLGWSTKHPTVYLWTAQDPKTLDVYVYREYTRSGNTEMYADEIMMLEEDDGYVETYADPNMFYKQKPQDAYAESDSNIFLRKGKYMQPAINDRELGWRIVKQWLSHNDRREPKLKIFNECRQLITTLPTLKYDTRGILKRNDLDTTMQDDAADALRYVLISGYTYPTSQDLVALQMEMEAEEIKEARMRMRRDLGEDENYGSYEESINVSEKSNYI